jgi:hypothetical protein
VLNFTGAVFHESRCGSTLVANLLSAVESSPPLKALCYVCGANYSRCSIDTVAAVLQDVVYLMSRTDDVNEECVFFKIQSAVSRNLPVFTKAFPNTPYLFVYREPVQVMMSHLKQGIGRRKTLCDVSTLQGRHTCFITMLLKGHTLPVPSSPMRACSISIGPKLDVGWARGH